MSFIQVGEKQYRYLKNFFFPTYTALGIVSLLVALSLTFLAFQNLDNNVFAQEFTQNNDTLSSAFTILNESSPIPSKREMILTDEILALGTDIDTIKNASIAGDFKVVHNKTLEIVTGPNWGNISADLLYRKNYDILNNFVIALGFLNSLTKDTTQNTREENATIVRESNELVNDYDKVLDSLAVPIFDAPKIVTNLVLPAILVGIVILAIPKIRRKYRIRY